MTGQTVAAAEPEMAPDAELDRFAAELRRDAKSWSAREDGAIERGATATLVLAAQAATPRKRAKPAAVKAPEPVQAKKNEPFSFHYEGISHAEYLAGRVARGAR